MMMSKRLLAGVAGLAALGLAGSAMAQDPAPTNESAEVAVSVEILPVASISAANSIALILGDRGADNWHALESTMTHRNNTLADVTVDVRLAEASPMLPGDLVYWLFRGTSKADADTFISGNSAGDFAAGNGQEPGSFTFSGLEVNSGGTASVQFATLAISDATNGTVIPVVYAADARASLPPPATSNTIVTWTIAPNSGE